MIDPSDISYEYKDQTVILSNDEDDIPVNFFVKFLKFVTEPKHDVLCKINADGRGDDEAECLIEILDKMGPQGYWLDALAEYRKRPYAKVEAADISEDEKNTLRALFEIIARGFGSNGWERDDSLNDELVDAYLKIPYIKDGDRLESIYNDGNCYMF